MQKKIPGSIITVPIPDHPELRIGTLQSIIRQSQLPRSLFEEWEKKRGVPFESKRLSQSKIPEFI